MRRSTFDRTAIGAIAQLPALPRGACRQNVGGALSPLPFVGVGVCVMKLDMGLRGFAGVMFGMFVMGVSEMRMMGARFVIAILDERGGFAMMLRGVFMVLGGVLVMICSVLGVRHGRLLFNCRILRPALNSAILRQTRDGRRQKALPTSLS